MSAVVTYYILVVQDKRGTFWSGVVNEMGDTIQVYGLSTPEGAPLYIESEAYHVESWCKDNGLLYALRSRQEEVFV